MKPNAPASILVVDDDEFIRQTLVEILELNGYRAEAAANGAEALALAGRRSPSVVITDIEMPEMNGYELLEAFRRDENLRSIPVIVISAKADRSATRRGMELGADDYITKPFTEHEVIRSIQTRLEKKELLDELDAFAHTVAHDLRNPLGTLTNRLYMLQEVARQTNDPAMNRHVDAASVAARRLAGIIDDMLVLAGVHRQKITPTLMEMTPIVTEALDRLDDLFKRTGATVSSPGTWPSAAGYAPWITHVWTNYLSNAAKYAGPQAEITIGAELRDEGRCARYWVQDRGPGVPDDARAKLFVPFSTIFSARATGHGLGLSIVRRIVERLGGQVGFEPAPGSGSRFWFELPTTPRRETDSPFPG